MLEPRSPEVAVIGCGGTISSLSTSSLDGMDYPEFGQKLGIDQVLERIPEVASVAHVMTVPFRSIGSPNMTPADWFELRATIQTNGTEGINIVSDKKIGFNFRSRGAKMRRLLLVALLAIPFTASAVVIRSGVKDAKYRVPASAFPALADMPGEGHGVLIAPRWVVTAAHAAPMEGMEEDVTIGGVARRVKRVITHPGYRKLPEKLVQEALASGDLSKVHAFLASSDDIALVELASPVTDVAPVPLYRGDNEVGMAVQLVGKGATGNGVDGQAPDSSHRTVPRRAFNAIVGADARYVWYRFGPPSSALPLEGITGSGDSGGPLLIGEGRSRQLVGLASWGKYPPGHPFLSHWAAGRPSWKVSTAKSGTACASHATSNG